jgi:hypothetical protein
MSALFHALVEALGELSDEALCHVVAALRFVERSITSSERANSPLPPKWSWSYEIRRLLEQQTALASSAATNGLDDDRCCDCHLSGSITDQVACDLSRVRCEAKWDTYFESRETVPSALRLDGFREWRGSWR